MGSSFDPKIAEDSTSIGEFKKLMYEVQNTRRQVVELILGGHIPDKESICLLSTASESLKDKLLKSSEDELSNMEERYQLCIYSKNNEDFRISVKDEIYGLKKDLSFLQTLVYNMERGKGLMDINLDTVLAPYHPNSANEFKTEFDCCVRFLQKFVDSYKTEGKKPIFITDWDGTMKDYCAQYATNLQPVYSAICITKFATLYTRLSAVLTAGPLRGPGILDLTALSVNGPMLFSGSWGREWWIGGKRTVHCDGITEEGIDALNRLNDEVVELLNTKNEYSQFGLVGSGLQRKVDRLTLGVQTVDRSIESELSSSYIDEIKNLMHRVDPYEKVLHFDASQELEIEVVVQSDGTIWNKADGVNRVVESVKDTLDPPGYILICGDTFSDLPMLKQALEKNSTGVMTCFVTTDKNLQESVCKVVKDPERRCFVSCPDVIHAAMLEIIKKS